ncbi:MAG: hypothetical protein IKU47_07195 [Oscillospiraceae bacterium]|nr:hypothetical protein [Oscillospiraceae bacterium]
MAISKAQLRATAKYVKNNYDEIKLRVPKGLKDEIREHAEIMDDGSINAFVLRAIRETLERDTETSN